VRSRHDPPARTGLASIMAAMSAKGVKAGGPAEPALDENALSEAWADLGASLGASAGADRLSFSLRSSRPTRTCWRAPCNWPPAKWGNRPFPTPFGKMSASAWKASLREANTRPATLASRAFNRAVYGGHPYGQEMTEATLAAIGVADLQALHDPGCVPGPASRWWVP